ncbi:hypothetical protein BaRGS_00009430 [Batillaria attramentaria]|uniref:Uncharacterized protein n=1 Tax=Batillaria attramentaria TaxID=370345 RepID=A0ABD0LJ81_9CAEN
MKNSGEILDGEFEATVIYDCDVPFQNSCELTSVTGQTRRHTVTQVSLNVSDVLQDALLPYLPQFEEDQATGGGSGAIGRDVLFANDKTCWECETAAPGLAYKLNQICMTCCRIASDLSSSIVANVQENLPL